MRQQARRFMTEKLNEFLKENKACEEGYIFAKDLTLEQFYLTCPRGDWMLWLFEKMQPTKKNELRLAAAHCANTVRFLMTDKRSTDVVDYIIDNNGAKPPLGLIKAAAYAADAASGAYVNYAASDAAYAANGYDGDTSDASDAYLTYAYYAAASDAAYAAEGYAGDAAKKENQNQTAKICREILKFEIW